MHGTPPPREHPPRRTNILWTWGPVLLWLAGIFYFSAQPDPLRFLFNAIPGAAARALPPPNGELADRPLTLPQIQIDLNVGGLAHFAEYVWLMAFLLRALTGGDRRPARSVFLTALAIALPLALLDETYQEFFPNRGFETGDVLLDLAGMLLAGAFYWIWDLKERTH